MRPSLTLNLVHRSVTAYVGLPCSAIQCGSRWWTSCFFTPTPSADQGRTDHRLGRRRASIKVATGVRLEGHASAI